jgi:hypothetical protein
MANDLLLEVQAVGHVYADGSHGLADCSLAIRRGSRNALLGANGSGKTTLLLHLNGLLQPSSGCIRIDGQPLDYSRGGLVALRRRVGLVFQNPDRQLFSANVFEDVSFGPLNLGLDDRQGLVRGRRPRRPGPDHREGPPPARSWAGAILFAGSLVDQAATRSRPPGCEIRDSKDMTLEEMSAWLLDQAPATPPWCACRPATPACTARWSR